jgi:hypothetical protein
VEFERIERIDGIALPADRMLGIGTTSAGVLWISYQYGGVTLVGDGAVRTYTVQDGLPPSSLLSLSQTAAALRLAPRNATLPGDATLMADSKAEHCSIATSSRKSEPICCTDPGRRR